ncbi:hypothetical protein PCG10_010558 [Penicillium crustosum]|uniref:RRM domain-containing protein n=1 Tax=Penicillium crustosum TaxID=36656 RepID=A0A9P5GFC0_PENCR|nr:uncharacterized protein N7487_008075 [Penicillium crustosum]KAF7518781.1 hypothetical protein PCG10_010558 [Penicillium crustosum]KAJ5402179.1 hypothetical protein N7487_008075 [Penicillium crustosum]
MSERSGHLPELDEWPAAIGILATLDLLDPNDTREEPQTVTDYNTRKQLPSEITSGGASPLRKSSSDSASGPRASSQVSSEVPSEISTFPPLPPFTSTPSSIISSHHQSSSSSSTIRPPKTYLDLAPGYYSGSFELVPQVHPPPSLRPQFIQYRPDIMSQIDRNPVGFSDQFNSADVVVSNPRPSNATNMGWPFDLSGVPHSADFESFENASIEELLQQSTIPFGSVAEMRPPPRDGVLMISNIPFTVTRQEVVSFLGHSASLLPSTHGCPIHIIMERSTGKTMDCYIEFATMKDAQATVERLNRVYDAGSAPRMGSRHVDLELSTPAKLLKATFPRAKCIAWEDGNPVQLVNKDSWSTGFDGFLTDEELFCLTRLAEQPHRSAFASKVPQRCYESFISTIWKFPWHATHLYTVHHRYALFKTLVALIKALVERMQRTNTVGLDIRLLNELVRAGISCPAFNPRMKYCFAWWSQDQRGIESLDHDWCLYFPFDTMTYVPGHPSAASLFYAYIMSHGSVLRTENDGLINKHTHPEIERIFGRFWFEWDEDVARKKVFKDAIIYEASVLRKFIITGFQQLHRRQSSVSTIGTAPGSSPTQSVASIDSQRTISGSHNPSMNTVPTYQESSTVSASSNMASSLPEHGNTLNVPGNPRGSFQRLNADQYLPDTATHRPQASAAPYRPPHQRSADPTKPRNQSVSWRLPQSQEAHVADSNQSQDVIRPVYRAPHPTAQNVRSSSDPFGPVPSIAPAGHRSRSDAARLSNIDHQAIDELRATGRGPRSAKK